MYQGGPLVKIDRIYDTSLTLSNPTPGTYCLRLNAHEICSSAIVNRSTLYKKHIITIAPPITAEVTGKIIDADTGEGLSEATVSFDQGAYVLTTASDGTFSSSVTQV